MLRVLVWLKEDNKWIFGIDVTYFFLYIFIVIFYELGSNTNLFENIQ